MSGGAVRVAAIVPAAGAGARMELDRPKAFLALGGRALLTLAVEAACACPAVGRVVVAVPKGWERRAEALLPEGDVRVVAGGASRQESVRLALESVPAGVDAVVCHDAARALATPALFDDVLRALNREAGGVVPVVPTTDTVKRVRGGWVVGTEPRDELALAQTPQAFWVDPLREAHARAAREGKEFTDDASLMEWAGHRIRTVPGEPDNIKVTRAEDLGRAGRVLEVREAPAEAPGWERRRTGG